MSPDALRGGERERWSSRLAFIFASIGAAIGFGNVWRFPSLAYEYGGGAFFIPYILALVLVGLPLLILEITLGQVYQTGDMGAFGAINKRLRGIGVTSVMNGYFIVVYYAGLIAWSVRSFFETFRGIDSKWLNVTGEEAYGYFLGTITGLDTVGDDMLPTRLVGPNVGYLFLVWAIVFMCVAFGIHNEGRITYFTMGLPIVTLFILLGKAVSLPGAQQGIQAYIGEWDMSVLSERPECWSRAVSQIFFSLGVTFGILTAFGSHCERDAPAFSNSVIIALCNSGYSFIAGFAVFASLGYLAQEEGKTIAELKIGGPGLVFGSYPVVLATLPGGVHWVRLLFLTLFLLGIDSAFALLEAVLTVGLDAKITGNTPRWALALVFCIASFLFGLLYVTDAGLFFLDAVDFYINFIMILVGFFEAFAAGWIYGIEKQIQTLGLKPVLIFMCGTQVIWVIASCLWFALDKNNALAGWLFLLFGYIVMMSTVFFLLSKVKASQPDWTWKALMYELFLSNAFQMCDDFQGVVGFLPKIWAFTIKHIIPPILLVLFINLACADTSTGEPLFGNYEGYPKWPYQIMGIFIVILTLVIFMLGVTTPSAYNWLALREHDEHKELEMNQKEVEDDYADEEQPIPEEAEVAAEPEVAEKEEVAKEVTKEVEIS